VYGTVRGLRIETSVDSDTVDPNNTTNRLILALRSSDKAIEDEEENAVQTLMVGHDGWWEMPYRLSPQVAYSLVVSKHPAGLLCRFGQEQANDFTGTMVDGGLVQPIKLHCYRRKKHVTTAVSHIVQLLERGGAMGKYKHGCSCMRCDGAGPLKIDTSTKDYERAVCPGYSIGCTVGTATGCFGQRVASGTSGMCACAGGEGSFSRPEKWTLGGTVKGLQPGSGDLVLADMTPSELSQMTPGVGATQVAVIRDNGPFEFPYLLADGQSWSVHVAQNPPGMRCVVSQDQTGRTGSKAQRKKSSFTHTWDSGAGGKIGTAHVRDLGIYCEHLPPSPAPPPMSIEQQPGTQAQFQQVQRQKVNDVEWARAFRKQSNQRDQLRQSWQQQREREMKQAAASRKDSTSGSGLGTVILSFVFLVPLIIVIGHHVFPDEAQGRQTVVGNPLDLLHYFKLPNELSWPSPFARDVAVGYSKVPQSLSLDSTPAIDAASNVASEAKNDGGGSSENPFDGSYGSTQSADL